VSGPPPRLPPPVVTVRGPDWLPASRLDAARACPLSVALAASDADPLPSHPKAVYGSILHRLYEAAARGDVEPGPDFPRRMRTELDRLVAGRPPGVPAPERVYGYLEWLQRSSDVVARAGAVVGDGGARPSRLAPSSPGRPSPFRPDDAPPPFVAHDHGRWAEVWLASPRLRVRGKADLVEREGDHVTVVDLKTGKASGADGGVAERAALQLRAYGLVVLELVPRATVHLVVAAGSTRPVPFGPSDQEATRAVLADLAGRLPAGAAVDAADLATPGAPCRFCSGRHRCPAYAAAAPPWWREGAPHPVPADVWGRVESAVREGGSVSLSLRDAADRLVRVARLREGLVGDVSEGDELHAFGLQGRGGRTEDGLHLAPTRYADLGVDGEGAAWSLAVFGRG